MLENKVGMIFGVANKRSIAWACATACAEHGAKMAFTYQGERLKENVEKLAGELEDSLIVPCDVTNQAEVDAAFKAVEKNTAGSIFWFIPSHLPHAKLSRANLSQPPEKLF
jgi:enoyl-[acyl-carrier protein] reductase I